MNSNNKDSNSNIFSKIKNIVYNNINGLLKVDRKYSYKKSLETILNEHNVSLEVRSFIIDDFIKNTQHISDENNLEQVSNIIWLTIVSAIEKNILHISDLKEINVKDIIVFGLPGSGKTCFLTKYFKFVSTDRVNYSTDDSNSLTLLQQYSNVVIADNVDFSIYETNKIDSMVSTINTNYKTKVIFVIDCNTDFCIVRDLIKSVSNIDFIVISKIDQVKKISLLIEIPYITKAKIIFLTDSEVSNDKSLKQTTLVISILASHILGKQINSKKQIQQLIDSQKNNIDLNTYRIYLHFINQLDSDKIDNLLDIYNKLKKTAGFNLNLGDGINNLDHLKDRGSKLELTKNTKFQINVINSLTKKERLMPDIISNNRIKEIIIGSGTSNEIFINTMNAFTQYKKTMAKIKLDKNNYDGILNNL